MQIPTIQHVNTYIATLWKIFIFCKLHYWLSVSIFMKVVLMKNRNVDLGTFRRTTPSFLCPKKKVGVQKQNIMGYFTNGDLFVNTLLFSHTPTNDNLYIILYFAVNS